MTRWRLPERGFDGCRRVSRRLGLGSGQTATISLNGTLAGGNHA